MRRGVANLEIVLVVIVLTMLAGILAPQVATSAHNMRLNQTTFRLQTIRTAIAKHQARHGSPPADLRQLTTQHGAAPLLKEIPLEEISGSREVEVLECEGPIQVSGAEACGGWIYNRATGEIRINLGAHRGL